MKFLTYVTIVCISLFLVTACKKHTATPPVDQLPPETQTGANTFGCLVNGKVFKPKGISITPILQCYYQNLYGTDNPGYFFGLHGVDHSNPEDFSSVGIYLDSVEIKNTGVIPLTERDIKGKGRGKYGHYYGNYIDIYYTNDSLRGELDIKKIDSIQQIVSGTFWFNAINDKGDTVKITDGRFDMHYTR